MSNDKRGIELARRLFKLGDMPHDKTQRIQFMGGHWPEKETELGGMCEQALANWFSAELTRLDALGDD